MKIMSFKKKIDKILDTNTLGINSINGLEMGIGASTGAVNKFYNEDREPGKATIKKIKKAFNIDDISWASGEFDLNLKGTSKEPIKVLPMDAWVLLEDDNRTFKKEINELWDMVRFLRGQSVKPHE